ncbi:MAG TPA: hypothetical protein VME40_05520 [Caulobacteraceae bacterium]|nr:hypothetical protein [Caulobacteraceae bacterium]
MAHDPVWGRPGVRRRARPPSPLAGILFVAAMSAAFWIGAVWASQPWWPSLR